jgi:predicted transcriptional regulator
MGIIIPIMGMKSSTTTSPPPSGVADALFGRVRQRVLALLLGHPEQSFYANEIIRWVGSGSGAVQRELARLSAAGLITVTRIGRQRHYQANATSSIYLFMNFNVSSSERVPPAAPLPVTHSAPAALARCAVSSRDKPSQTPAMKPAAKASPAPVVSTTST